MPTSIERIWEISRAFQPSRVLLTAVELGVFAALGDGLKSSAEVASQIGGDPRATDRLMNALAALGLLVKAGNMFSNSPDALEHLVPGKSGYVGESLMHVVNLWRTWSTLTDAVRAGTSVYERKEHEADAYARPFIAAMHTIAGGQANNIVSKIDLRGVQRVLDLGGGSGAYSIAFCRAKQDIQAVVFDLPNIVPITQEYVGEAGLSDRITTITGDFNTDELPTGFDLAFLSQILHSNSPEENIELFKKCHRSLNPGGRIVIQEFVVDEDRTSPPWAVLFALNMLVATKAGDTYTESEIKGWFAEASLKFEKRIDPPGTNTTLLTAKE